MTYLLFSILFFLLFFGIGFSFECTARYEIHTQPPYWPNGLNAQLSVDVKNTSILTDGWAINFTAKGFGSKSPFSISSFWNVGSISRVDNGDNTVTYSLGNAHYNAHNPQFIGFNAETILPHPRNLICGLSINNNPCSITSSPPFPPPTSSSILLSYDYHNDDPTLPLIVLIHGITDNRHSWDPLIPLLTPYYRILNMDLRGHGQSTITPNQSDYEPQALAADVYHTILQVVGSEELPLMVGHSLGGLVVSVYAHEYPVRGVVCVDQSMDLRDLQVTVKAVEPLLMGDEAMFKLLFANIDYGALNASEAARLDALRNPIQSVVIGVWGLMLDLTTEQLSARVDEFMQVPGGTSYLALFGTDIGPAYEGWLKERIPAAEYELWGPAGHYIHLIYPHLFVQRVRDFDSMASLKTCL